MMIIDKNKKGLALLWWRERGLMHSTINLESLRAKGSLFKRLPFVPPVWFDQTASPKSGSGALSQFASAEFFSGENVREEGTKTDPHFCGQIETTWSNIFPFVTPTGCSNRIPLPFHVPLYFGTRLEPWMRRHFWCGFVSLQYKRERRGE